MEFITSAPLDLGQVYSAWVTAAVAGAGLLIGLFQNMRASKMERQNQRPEYRPDANILQNQAIANRMAQTGLPAQQYEMARSNINQGTAAALRSAERSGRPGSIASILGQSTRAIAGLDAQNAAARQQNQMIAMQQNQAVAGENRMAFDWNERQQYLSAAQRIGNLRAAGMQNAVGGVGLFAQASMTPGTTEYGWFNGRKEASTVASNVASNVQPTIPTSPQNMAVFQGPGGAYSAPNWPWLNRGGNY